MLGTIIQLSNELHRPGRRRKGGRDKGKRSTAQMRGREGWYNAQSVTFSVRKIYYFQLFRVPKRCILAVRVNIICFIWRTESKKCVLHSMTLQSCGTASWDKSVCVYPFNVMALFALRKFCRNLQLYCCPLLATEGCLQYSQANYGLRNKEDGRQCHPACWYWHHDYIFKSAEGN